MTQEAIFAIEREGDRPSRWDGTMLIVVTGDSPAAIAAAVGASERTVQRWVEEGVPDAVSDIVAVRLDLHPEWIWPGWIEAGPISRYEDPAASPTARRYERPKTETLF